MREAGLAQAGETVPQGRILPQQLVGVHLIASSGPLAVTAGRSAVIRVAPGGPGAST